MQWTEIKRSAGRNFLPVIDDLSVFPVFKEAEIEYQPL